MQYTKEEFKIIVDRFNSEKHQWLDWLNKNVRNWEKSKKEIKDYPIYYDFISAREFKYWLKHSEEEDFVNERFCPICGEFIEVQHCGFQGKYKIGCEKHIKEIRMKSVQDGMMKKYGFVTPGKSKEIWEKIKQTNVEKYGVEFPLQDKNIHKKTIEKGNKNGSYIIGAKKGKETKKERYGNENYNNSKQIIETKSNASEQAKKETIRKLKNTLKECYGDENYNNPDKIRQTCLKKYGVTNPFAAEQFKKKIKENELKSRILNHTTQEELFESTNEYKDGLTYKENFNKKCYETKKRNKSFNSSKPEETLYEKLFATYDNVKRQYRSSVYPFCCDFYITRFDLYIELQAFPNHGKHPFDPNNMEDVTKVNLWKKKAKEINSEGKLKIQYENYIRVWTIEDPLKRKIAKENNLKFLEIFPDDFNNDYDSIVKYIHNYISENCLNISDEWRNDEIFGITKGQCLDLCLTTPFPGTLKWPADNPIWDCNVAKSISPKEGYSRVEYLVKAIDNLYWILNKNINENKHIDFVNSQKQKMLTGGIELVRMILNRFTVAKICPKVTALMPSKFLEIINQSAIDISCGIYCPMAGFGGIIEGAKRWFKQKGIDYENKIEAYDINPILCKYYGWTQRDVLAQKIKTDKIVFVCPPFGLKTERWFGTPEDRDDEFKTNYLDFHDWCKLIREYINAPNYIFVGPEESGIRKNENIKSGLFTKQFGIRWYPEYSN